MNSDKSVTMWLRELEKGDAQAAQQLWERYYTRLVALAKKKLGGAPRRAADEEDVVISAFESFCRGAEEQRFPALADRDDLWQVLVMITVRKAINQAAHEGRQKRGGGRVRGDSALGPSLDDVVGESPSPVFAAILAEEYRRLLNSLTDDTLRQIAVRKMEGFSHEQIAEQLDCSTRTVVRKLRLIRKMFSEEAEANSVH